MAAASKYRTAPSAGWVELNEDASVAQPPGRRIPTRLVSKTQSGALVARQRRNVSGLSRSPLSPSVQLPRLQAVFCGYSGADPRTPATLIFIGKGIPDRAPPRSTDFSDFKGWRFRAKRGVAVQRLRVRQLHGGAPGRVCRRPAVSKAIYSLMRDGRSKIPT